MPTDVATLKGTLLTNLAGLQQKLADSRPANVVETEYYIALSTGYTSRLLICYAAVPPEDTPRPYLIIFLFHGVIHVLGFPRVRSAACPCAGNHPQRNRHILVDEKHPK